MKLSPKQDVSRKVVRIVRKRIRKVVRALADAECSPNGEAVHSARTELKKIRATQKLVRPQLERKRFRKEQRVFRNAARPLSAVRDAKVLVDSLNGLGSMGPELEGRLSHLKQELLDRQASIEQRLFDGPETVACIARKLRRERKRVSRWPLRKHGWKAIGPGLREAYERARTAMERVRRDSSDEALHKWRKRTKDLRYELELLQSQPHERLDGLVQRAVRLSDVLGQDHDLAVLVGVIGAEPAYSGLRTRIEEKRGALQLEAVALGSRLLSEAPEVFARKIRRYWRESARGSPSG